MDETENESAKRIADLEAQVKYLLKRLEAAEDALLEVRKEVFYGNAHHSAGWTFPKPDKAQ